MDSTIIGIHVDDSGLSRENILVDALKMRAGWSLVRNSPDMARIFWQNKINVIYRQKNDGSNDDNAMSYDAGDFVRIRHENTPPGGYIHGGNEIGPSKEYAEWTTDFQKALRSYKRKGVILNLSYGKTVAEWALHEKNITDAVENGDIVGFHFYDNLSEDLRKTLWGWKPMFLKHGGFWAATEIGYFTDSDHGFRGDINEKYVDFWEYWSPIFQTMKIILFPFSYENWPRNSEGEKRGFGYADVKDGKQERYMISCFSDMNTKYIVKGLPVVVSNIDTPANPGVPTNASVIVLSLNMRKSISGVLIRTFTLGEGIQIFTDTIDLGADKRPWVYLKDSKGNYGWAATSDKNGDKWITWGDAPNPNARISLQNPLPGSVISAHFGVPRVYDGVNTFHEGTDFALKNQPCAVGDVNVLASADGVVISVRDYFGFKATGKFTSGYGMYVKIQHNVEGQIFITWYGHLSAPSVCMGQQVKAGDPVGILGSTGNSTGYHCHLNLQWLGHGLKGYVIEDAVNPEDFLKP